MYRRFLTIGMVCLMSVLVLMVPKGADAQDKIAGPWLWMIAPTEPGRGGANSTDIDSLAAASGGAVTEAEVATNGANIGDVVGNYAWTLSTISKSGRDNVTDIFRRIGWADGYVNDHSSYALITLESLTEQNNVTMRVGSDDSIKVWLNGAVVHRNAVNRAARDFQNNFQVNLRAGDNLLLVKVSNRASDLAMFVGIDADVNAVYKPPTPPGDDHGDVNDGRIYTNNFDNKNSIAGLHTHGIPAPIISTVAGRTGLDPNGDGWHDSGVVFNAAAARFSVTAGLQVSFDFYMNTNTQNWHWIGVGMIATDYQPNAHPDWEANRQERSPRGDQYWFLWMHPMPTTGRMRIGAGPVIDGDVDLQTEAGSVAYNQAEWNQIQIEVLSDRQLKIHLNGSYLATVERENASSLYGREGYLKIYGRSSRDPVLVDNLEIRSSTVSIAPPAVQADANGDGVVTLEDLEFINDSIGKTGENAADLNGDGIVSLVDLVLAAGALGNAAGAPAARAHALKTFTAEEVQQWLTKTRLLEDKSPTYQRGIAVLEQLLALLTPRETVLLANYPNPFNPETWIPYQLAEPTDVTLTIYDIQGRVVRTLDLGHQRAGMYQNRGRAAYWDGRNAHGEPVASGVYFYTLTAGDFSATRKMLIRK